VVYCFGPPCMLHEVRLRCQCVKTSVEKNVPIRVVNVLVSVLCRQVKSHRTTTLSSSLFVPHSKVTSISGAADSGVSTCNCPHVEMKLKRNSFETVSELFRSCVLCFFHFNVRTALVSSFQRRRVIHIYVTCSSIEASFCKKSSYKIHTL